MALKLLQEVKEHRWPQLEHISDRAVPQLQGQLHPLPQPYSHWSFSSWTSVAMTNLATDQVLKFTVKSYYNSQTYSTTYLLTVCQKTLNAAEEELPNRCGVLSAELLYSSGRMGLYRSDFAAGASPSVLLLVFIHSLWAITDTNAGPKSTCRIAIRFNLSPNTSSYCS